MLKKANSAAESILKIFDWATRIMLLFCVVTMLLQIIFRITETPNQWTQLAAIYSFSALVFCGGVNAVLHAEQIAITTIIDMLPMPIRRYIDMFINFLVAIMSALLTYSSWNLIQASRILTSPAMLWFKMNYLYVPIGLSCLMMTLMALLRIANLIADKDLLAKEAQLKIDEEVALEKESLEEYEKIKEDM